MPHGTSFPVLCNRTIQAPLSADADFVAICESSTDRYLCKGQSRFPYLPATEWICSTLARDCGLPVPAFSVVELATRPGTYFFGSRWLGGAIDFTAGLSRVSNPSVFSETFGIDWFSHNDDRHLGNFLYLELAGEVVARPMDFSRAWMYHGWPLPPLPLPNTCNTMTQRLFWAAAHGYVRPMSIIDRVNEQAHDWMQKTIDEMPQAWVTQPERDALIAWWKSSSRQSRVNNAKSTIP
jgi:hypothetical protein